MWKLTDSEWKVLEALWAGGPQHLGQILGALAPETGWSRTTVHTYLTRMAAKGLVSMDQSSPRRYAAIPSRETCAARERRDLVDRVYDGSAGQLVAAFVKDGSLSPQEREELRRLPDKYRTVLHLYYYEDMTTEEIARLLDRSPATVRSQLMRGRDRLRVLLEEG